MASNTAYAEYVMQITSEKLESESIESKISCYQLLQLALPKYSAIDLKQYAKELWISIRIDTLKPIIEEDPLAHQALATLTKLSDVLSADQSECDSLLDKIWKDLEISLKTPELNLISSTVKIFLAFSSNNLVIFNHFFDRSHPILLQDFLFNPDSEHQLLCLESFLMMIEYAHQIDARFTADTVNHFLQLLLENSAQRSFPVRRLVILVFSHLVCFSTFEKEQLVILVRYTTCCVQESAYSQPIL